MSLTGRDAVNVDEVSTPRGRGRPLGATRAGRLAGGHPQELAAQRLDALRARSGLDPQHVDDDIPGCVSHVDA